MSRRVLDSHKKSTSTETSLLLGFHYRRAIPPTPRLPTSGCRSCCPFPDAAAFPVGTSGRRGGVTNGLPLSRPSFAHIGAANFITSNRSRGVTNGLPRSPLVQQISPSAKHIANKLRLAGLALSSNLDGGRGGRVGPLACRHADCGRTGASTQKVALAALPFGTFPPLPSLKNNLLGCHPHAIPHTENHMRLDVARAPRHLRHKVKAVATATLHPRGPRP